MTSSKDEYTLSYAPTSWLDQSHLLDWNWDDVSALSSFKLYDDSRLAHQQTVTRLCCNRQTLFVRFDCEDSDIWGTYTQRNDPIYEEEAVEIFLGHGEANPTRYYEFEVSPNGVLFDATVYNPTSQRADMEVNTEWNCEGIQWVAQRNDAENKWTAILVIPWASVSPSDSIPKVWRANFYRIERPCNGEAEFSCWSPTMAIPADFHKPAYFGTLRLPEF